MADYGEVKNIRNLALIDRLYQLFKTEGGYKEPPQINPGVQPVIDMQGFNRISVQQQQLTSSTTATHNFTVPANKRWIVRAWSVTRANAGTLAVKLLNAGGYAVTVTSLASSTDYQSTTLPNWPDVILNATDYISFIHGAGTSGNISSQIWYEEMDV